MKNRSYSLRAGNGETTDDETKYVPGSVVNLWVTTLEYTKKYKGFFARAVDEEGSPVGEWEFPGTDSQTFWSPPECGSKHIIHKDADLKPFRVQIHYRAPPKGTGKITFHALIKRGDPNTGEFWYPNDASVGKLTLEEATETPAPKLALAARGESCAAFCAGRRQVCDAGAMRATAGASADGLLGMLEPITTASQGVLAAVACRPPILQSCSSVAPAAKPSSGECWFYRSDASCRAITNSGTGAASDLSSVSGCGAGLDPASDQAVCEVSPKDMDTRRLCACKAAPTGSGGRARRAATQVEAAPAADVATSKAAGANASQPPTFAEASRASPGAAPSLALLGASAALLGSSAGVVSPARLAVFALVATVLMEARPAHGHNWLHTPSRSRKKASTTRPCIPRKASDTHQQVGPGQTFAIKWATGHAGDGSARCLHPVTDVSDPKCVPIGKEYTSISIIRASDYHMLKHEDFNKMLEEYVVEAPTGASNHLDPHWSRYHGLPRGNCGNCDGLGEDRGGIEGFVYFANMTENPEPPKGSHFHTPGRAAFSFAESELTDRSAGVKLLKDGTPPSQQRYLQSITNESKDWLTHGFSETGSGLFRYTNEAMKNDRRVSYHSKKHPWLLMAGVYPHIFQRPSDYDAIRVEVPTELDGTKLEPGHYIVHYRWKGYSDCVDVNVHPTPMKDIDGRDDDSYIWNKIEHCQYFAPIDVATKCHVATGSPDACVAELTAHRSEQKCGTNCATRFGVNVVPMVNPAPVMHKDQINIPWDNGTCANSDWTRIKGEETASLDSSIDWSRWQTAAVHKDTRCNKGDLTLSISGRKKTFTATLAKAVLECTRSFCAGFEVKLLNGRDIKDGAHIFQLCRGDKTQPGVAAAPRLVATAASKGWAVYVKPAAHTKAAVAPAAPLEGPTYNVFFGAEEWWHQPLDISTPAGETWFQDAGKQYVAESASCCQSVPFS